MTWKSDHGEDPQGKKKARENSQALALRDTASPSPTVIFSPEPDLVQFCPKCGFNIAMFVRASRTFCPNCGFNVRMLLQAYRIATKHSSRQEEQQ